MTDVIWLGDKLFSEREVHDTLAEQVDFGDYYGCNIAPCEIDSWPMCRGRRHRLKNSAASRSNLGEATFSAIVRVFEEAHQQGLSWNNGQ